MRQTMESAVSARILVGGRAKGFKGKMAGILEEFKIARDHHHPLFLIGGFGGIAGMLCAAIDKQISSTVFLEEACRHDYYKSIFMYYASKGQPVDYSWIDSITIDDLDNGLTLEENKRLFITTNIMEIVSLILHGLSKKLNNA